VQTTKVKASRSILNYSKLLAACSKVFVSHFGTMREQNGLG
jgi:hypothetical protein